ncbi:uroporphyrinogen-III C-methyltransferase [Pseudoalteromonas sp. S16_S37]|uniref:uroporphyrinogen-III C-methyltransferase n=1 Tax=Pseudoalteromonas sp. S16_S37 TaxID=2720228 RepID=UPI001680176C|nr:uroporphyrinogen-III C-methyltransferase [Pseudoalteromonas sp. S16_S37]MBD1582687.1 uroporphyrinogen-III synthase [Pseudoalteromonas sp. S16_S37]
MMRIAITRPEGKGLELAKLLSQQGIFNLHTPILRIEPCQLSSSQLAPIQDADIIVFISQDSVKQLAVQIDSLPATAQLFAVGEQTANAIQSCFSRKAIVPKQRDSEGLLALAPLQQLESKQVVLVKGQGGRPLLAKTFKQRGAILNVCAVYKRVAQHDTSDGWLDHWRSEQIDGIVVTSNATIDAIFNARQKELLNWLKSRHFFVISERSARYLHNTYEVSQQCISIANGPDDLAIFNSIMPNQQQQGSQMSEQETQSGPEMSNKTPLTQPVFKQKISKLAVLALLVAVTGGVATAGLIIHGQQISDKTYAALAQLQKDNAQLSEQLSQAKSQLTLLQSSLQQQNGELEERLALQSQTVDAQLNAALSQAKQQISGALSSEVTYLQRMAEFKANAEQDYQGAIAVLKRLYDVVKNESDNTALLSAIATDIAALQAQPKPAVETLYLQLHGMLQQVDNLALKGVKRPAAFMKPSNELSKEVSDWRINLARSWQQFKETFLTIKSQEITDIQPLLDSQQKQMLRAQLRSYLSQAQLALVDKKASVFFTSLDGASKTLETYFDKNNSGVQSLADNIEQLQQIPLQFHTNVDLLTPDATKEWLK